MEVSVIIPMYNAQDYIEECLVSILGQTGISLREVELIIHDDGSTDGSNERVMKLLPRLREMLGRVVLTRGEGPTGVGSARNRACESATTSCFVFCDADDVMCADRLRRSVDAVRANPELLIGGTFERIPEGATPRYTQYHRELKTSELQAYAFRDTPLPMPSIACHRKVFERIGGFREGPGIPEDLWFCYDHMEKGGKFLKLVGNTLVKYRHHESMMSRSLHRKTLLQVRVSAFERIVLPYWDQFSIWGAGRDGKDVFKMLSARARAKVREFLDIDPRKIGLKKLYDKDVNHFTNAVPPFITCVALNRTDGEFEANLASLNLIPGKDFYYMV